MPKIIVDIVSNFIMVSSLLYTWHKLLDKKIDFKNPRLYITLLGIMIISIFNYLLIDKFVRIILLTIIFMFFFRFLFKENLHKCIITPIFYQVIVMISETLYALLITILFTSNVEEILDGFLGTFLTNIVVVSILVILIQFKRTKRFYNQVLDFTDKIKNKQLLLLCMIIIIALNIFPMTIYYRVDFKILLLFYSSMIIVCCVIIMYTLKTQNSYNEVSNKYDVAIKSLNDYESMMSKYRVANHENKNLLKTIRAMIVNKDKDIPEYIDTMIEDKYEDDDKLLFKVGVIPSGGLRATIYSEILKIQKNNIKYELNIDKRLKTVDLIELDTKTVIDICKIIGVYIDNAIEAVKKLGKRFIDISLFIDDNTLNIKVSNNYSGTIDINKIYEEGYTTKGQGHGYGLPLVKKIVESNSIFGNRVEINKNIFSQLLIIEYKRKNHN